MCSIHTRSGLCSIISDISFLAQDYESVWGLALESYQFHMRYILLDTGDWLPLALPYLSTLFDVR